MTSAFENLCGPGQPLRVAPPDRKEFGGLLRSGHARLRDALNTTLPTGLFGSTTCRPTVACLSDASGGVTIIYRKSVGQGTVVSVSVDFGGRRFMKTKTSR